MANTYLQYPFAPNMEAIELNLDSEMRGCQIAFAQAKAAIDHAWANNEPVSVPAAKIVAAQQRLKLLREIKKDYAHCAFQEASVRYTSDYIFASLCTEMRECQRKSPEDIAYFEACALFIANHYDQ